MTPKSSFDTCTVFEHEANSSQIFKEPAHAQRVKYLEIQTCSNLKIEIHARKFNVDFEQYGN